MITYKYYKFPTQADCPSLEEWPAGVSVDVIGQIVDNPGTYNNEGNLITFPTFKDGWHVNVCYQENVDLSNLEQYEIQVQSPIRVWFGQPLDIN